MGKRPFWIQFLVILLLLVILGYFLIFVVLTLTRLFYPYELEWIEGASIDEILWIANGNALYGEPSISFIPAAYNPLYFVICAGFTKIIGDGFIPARSVSILASVGNFILLFLIIHRISKKRLPGLIAAGIYAASFRFAGAWMDLAKADSLFIFLILLAFYVGQRFKGHGGFILSGLIFVLSYYTKQVALPIILITAVFSLGSSRGRSWLQWATTFILGITIFGWLDIHTAGWYSFYTFDNYSQHERTYELSTFWVPMIKNFWPAILLSFSYPIYKIKTNREKNILQDYDFISQIGFILALIIASWTVFTKIWTYDNGFLPAVAGLAMSAGLGFDQLIENFTKFSYSKRSALFQGAGLILLLIQFAILYYSPLDQLPTHQDRKAKANFVQRLSELEGEILIYQHGYFNVLAGKDSYLHISYYGDVLGGMEPEGTDRNDWRREMTIKAFEDAIIQHHFEWIVIDERYVQYFSPYYIESSEPPVQFFPTTGAPGQKEYFLRRNPDALGGKQSLSSLIRDSQFSEVVETLNHDREILKDRTTSSFNEKVK